MEQPPQYPQYTCDVFHPWSELSSSVPFKTTKRCVGNGEEKLMKELGISGEVGGQNRVADVVHPVLGNISVKDMTHDDCTLGTEGCNDMRVVFRTVVNPFVSWMMKYKDKCNVASKFYEASNKKYGSSRHSVLEGIDRCELSSSNLNALDSMIKKLVCLHEQVITPSMNSEYIDDMIENIGNESLKSMLDKCIQKEAISMKLIIVHEEKGWLMVGDVFNLSCPRITRGAPRIHYKKLT